jgi:DNA-binding beta-propeller fold protein YncE
MLGRSLTILVVAVGTGIVGPADTDTRPSRAAAICGVRQPSRPRPRNVTRHYEYVVADGAICAYDIDHGHRVVDSIDLPVARGVRGVAASPSTGMLYVSYGGDGGVNGSGSLLKFDLRRRKLVWARAYGTGVDSMAVSRDGRTIYMPTGELASGRDWLVLDARSGRIRARIQGGAGPHNTVAGLSGRRVYLGGRNSNFLAVASTVTNRVVRRIGPLRSGVRPFTVNGRETIAYTTATGFLGFQVSSIRTGRVLYTVPVSGFGWDPRSFGPSAPSHGISLAPNEKTLYVIDAPNSFVHVFDVDRVPRAAPRQVADIRVSPLSGNETPCAYDCARDGWLQHSRDGRFVYVGDAGDVIDTRRRRVVATLPALRNSRKSLEIDWRDGRIVFTTSRYGLGYERR